MTLKPRFEGYVLPSKIYGCIDSGRPVLFIGPRGSDVHLLCKERPGLPYRRIEVGDAAAVEATLDVFPWRGAQDELRNSIMAAARLYRTIYSLAWGSMVLCAGAALGHAGRFLAVIARGREAGAPVWALLSASARLLLMPAFALLVCAEGAQATSPPGPETPQTWNFAQPDNNNPA